MFKNLMSNLGLEQIKIDTRLAQQQVCAGQEVQGKIVFRGISQDKQINRLDLRLMTRVEVEVGDAEFKENMCIAQWQISEAFQLQANQRLSIPFSIQLPYELPITVLTTRRPNQSQVWLDTHLDVDWNIDSTDKDMLQVVATPAMSAFLEAMQLCNFVLLQADVEKGRINARHFRSTVGCYQELEFIPLKATIYVQQIEVSFVAEAHQTHVLLELDRGGGHDQYATITIAHNAINVADLVQQIRKIVY